MKTPASKSGVAAPEPSDEALFQGVLSGDQEAVQALFDRYREGLVSHAARVLPSRDLAQDVVQEVFLKLLESPPARLQNRSLGPWLFRVARNLSLDRQRHGKFEIPAGGEGDLPSPPAGTGPLDPLSTLMRHSDAEHLRRLCEELPPELRRLVEGRMEQGLSFQQLADREGIPLGTALWRVHHALDILRRKWMAES